MQLRLQQPVAALAGDRVIVRLTAPAPPWQEASCSTRRRRAAGRGPEPSRSRWLAPRPQALSDEGADDLLRRLSETPFDPAAAAAGGRGARPPTWPSRPDRARGRDLAFTAEGVRPGPGRRRSSWPTEHGTVTIASLRDRLGISRRYAQAILEALDSHGITRRVGDERVLRRSHRNAAG